MEAQAHIMSTSQSARSSRWLLVGLVSWGLVACQTRPPPRAPQQEPTPAAPVTAVPAGAREYRVVASDSLLQIMVFRGGAMARLGHNHVIASHHLAGPVYVTDDPLETRFDISFPVSELTVDEPALRAEAGPDFSTLVPESAREGTRANLLSDGLLDSAQYPTVRLRATDVRAAGEAYDVGVEVTLKGSTYALRVPVTVERQDGAIVARGEFPLKQTQLGLKPFTVALGALVVLDDMQVRFEVVARTS
jgi:polyisoprenoid-binding protein YceI